MQSIEIWFFEQDGNNCASEQLTVSSEALSLHQHVSAPVSTKTAWLQHYRWSKWCQLISQDYYWGMSAECVDNEDFFDGEVIDQEPGEQSFDIS